MLLVNVESVLLLKVLLVFMEEKRLLRLEPTRLAALFRPASAVGSDLLLLALLFAGDDDEGGNMKGVACCSEGEVETVGRLGVEDE